MTRFLAMIALLVASPAVATPMQCDFSQKEHCQSGSPCGTTVANVVWVKLDLTAHTYSRCDTKGCDAYDVQIARSGVWANITFPERAMVAKLSNAGNLVEVVTLNDLTLISFGKCKGSQ